jgi:hypothetical protein
MITKEIEDELLEVIPQIVSIQNSAKTSHNTFVQLKKTHLEPPDSIKDKRTPIEPSPQYKKRERVEDGLDIFGFKKYKVVETDAPTLNSIKNQLRCSYEVHAYSGSSGDGFIVIVRTKIGTDVWRKTINFGPAVFTENDWSVENDTV